MEMSFHQRELDSNYGQSLDGSFRRAGSGISPDRLSAVSTSSKYIPTSRRVYRGLKDYAKKLVDVESFTSNLEQWILGKTRSSPAGRQQLFESPFQIDELRKLDYALEGILFQQLFRMPHSLYASDDLKEDEFLALEDFLRAAVEGLWRTFWRKDGPVPFLVSCPRYPGSKFYNVETAILRGRLAQLSGAALISKTGNDSHVRWDQVVEFALFKQDIVQEDELVFSASTISEAIFYGFHILLSRSLSKYNMVSCSSVHLLVLDSKFGGVIKFGGDLSKLDVNSSDPYHSVAEWVKLHAEVSVSPVEQIWNKLGNANWGDLGTLQLLLATFYSIVQWKGPPKKSIASLAADHSLRLEKRRIECRFNENDNGLLSKLQASQNHGEIVEVEQDEDSSYRRQTSHLKFNPGDVMVLEDQQGQQGFQIQDTLLEGNCLSYSAVSVENVSELLTLYVGSHPSRLEPSWEDMSLWYQVQRQTKVLNVLKNKGISSKYLPEIVASGRILHSGPCRKESPGGRCDHPWCGTPILVTRPVGEPLSAIISRNGPFSTEEALRCCRDCLSALRSASMANIQHGDICPENIIRVSDSHLGRNWYMYIPISWGHAVLEDRDSPAMNLQFSSTHALQQGKLYPASDAESLVYLLYFVCGGEMQQQGSIEAALQWRENCWARRLIQQQLGEVSALLKAFADYVDSLCGTPYPVDYDIWLKRLNRVIDGSTDRGKLAEEVQVVLRLEDVAESSGTSGANTSFSC